MYLFSIFQDISYLFLNVSFVKSRVKILGYKVPDFTESNSLYEFTIKNVIFILISSWELIPVWPPINFYYFFAFFVYFLNRSGFIYCMILFKIRRYRIFFFNIYFYISFGKTGVKYLVPEYSFSCFYFQWRIIFIL